MMSYSNFTDYKTPFFYIIVAITFCEMVNFFLCFFRLDFNQVYCVVKRGEYLGSQKVVHIPGIPIGVTTLSKDDESHVRLAIELKIDGMIISGVRNAAFLNSVKKIIGEYQNIFRT